MLCKMMVPFFVFLMLTEMCCKQGRRKYVSWKEMDQASVSYVIRDVVLGLPSRDVALGLDWNLGSTFMENLTLSLHDAGIKTSLYPMNREKDIDKICSDIKLWLSKSQSTNYVFLVRQHIMESLLFYIREDNLIHRKITYIFLWIKKDVTNLFKNMLHESIKIIIITNPRDGFYQIYYTQSNSKSVLPLNMVNWWSKRTGMFRYPLLPSVTTVYSSFHRRNFIIPVLHKPPWNFVVYDNEEIEVKGGRDNKLLLILADKLNFRIKYIDPPDHRQGSSLVNGSAQGVIGLVYSREVDLFIGDLTVTYERSEAVEFSFFTFVDSELFLTHAPGRLNEALALVRPFHWIVWPAIILTLFLSGPILYIFVISAGEEKMKKKDTFIKCVWITCTIFLQQAVKVPYKNQKVRFIIVLLSLSVTYVIGDLYSANLTSMLARPTKERPISTLEELHFAMEREQYQLLVEENSASHANLQNGSGTNKAIWSLMTKQEKYFIESAEAGTKLVRDRKKYVIIGGRETFYFDTQRFGAKNFYLSEKLNTRYSAIALQIGCPYMENFNTVLMRLFESGIYSKITGEEYQKLRQKNGSVSTTEKEYVSEGVSKNKIGEEESELNAMSMTTLQGAFYVLIIGHLLAVLVFLQELRMGEKEGKRKKFKSVNEMFVPKVTDWFIRTALRPIDEHVNPN